MKESSGPQAHFNLLVNSSSQNSEDQSRAIAEQNEYVKDLEASNEDYKETIHILEEKVDKVEAAGQHKLN